MKGDEFIYPIKETQHLVCDVKKVSERYRFQCVG